MAIRVSGLVSGLDTDSIVQELVAAYSTKKDKYVKSQTKLEWQMDAWKELNKKVNSLYKKLGNMKLSSYYNKKTTTVSDTTKATVMASGSALNGSQTLTIEQIATTGYITGGQLKKGSTTNTTLEELGMAAGSKGSIALTTKNGTKNIEVSSDMKVKDFVNALKEAGVSANYDATHNRVYVSAKESGEENDFGLTATDANGLAALKGMGLHVQSTANDAAYQNWLGYDQGNDVATRANFKNILETIAKYQGDETEPDSIAALQEANGDLKTDLTNLQADKKYATAFMNMREVIDGNGALNSSEKAELEGMLTKTDQELKDDGEYDRFIELKDKSGISDKEFKNLRSNAKAVDQYRSDPANSQVVGELDAAYNGPNKTADLQAWVDNNAAEMKAVSQQMNENSEKIAEKQAYIAEHEVLLGVAPAVDGTPAELEDRLDILMDKFHFAQSAKNDTDYSDGATRINAEDAKITLNGAEYVSASNDITINGITITALQTTAPGEKITITTQANVQGIYDSIKDFLKEYNALIKEMDELYNAPSAKGYEPLTDDEKDAMSDKEIEKWEEKIKDSILRRDDTLSSVMNLMTSSMAKGFTLSDGKTYSLGSFGVKTQGYLYAAENEGYCFHIDGDSEDEVSAGNNGGVNSLMKAIQENPDMVQEFFQKLSDDLYTKLDKKMQSSSLNTKFSIYHDKKMQSDYDQYTKTIKKWEEKVTAMEEYYYKKFAAMEKALSSLQSSTSALSGLLGS